MNTLIETTDLQALRVGLDTLDLVPAPARRDWMDATPDRFAYRCLPMVLANQHGWMLTTRHLVTARWDGSDRPAGVRVTTPHRPDAGWVTGHFGCGLLTWTLPFLFHSPPGVDLLIRGPSNAPRDGASPLEGLVETSWSPATATMNWQLTRPDHEVCFEPGDAVAMIVPVRRELVESCRPAITDDPDLHAGHQTWADGRSRFLGELQKGTVTTGWQRDYQKGRIGDLGPGGRRRSRLALRPFVEE